MKKILLLAFVLFGYSYTLYCDDLFHTGSCNSRRVSSCANNFSLSPAQGIPSVVITGGKNNSSTQRAALPPGMQQLCPTCPLKANQVSYAPLTSNVAALEEMVRQIEAIPNHQYYPYLADAMYSLKCTIIRAKENARLNAMN